MMRSAVLLLFLFAPAAFGQGATSAHDSDPSGNSGQGRPDEENGVVTNTRNPTRLMRGDQLVRPILMTGSVVLASGEKPLEPVLIKRACGARVTAEGYTDSKGKFSFSVGGSRSFASTIDASIGNDRPDDLITGVERTNVGLVGVDQSGGIDLSGCTLVADAPGYRSDPIMLTRLHSMDRTDVGQFILTPLGNGLATAVSITSLEAPKEAQKSYERALKEVRKGQSAKVEKVISDLEDAVAIYPRYAAAWTLLGQSRMQIGDIPGAEDALESALDADPRYIRPYEPLVLLRIGQQDWSRVAILADFVLSFNPGDMKMRWYQTVALFEQGHYDQAIVAIDRIQADPHGASMYPQTHHIRGLIYANRGEFSDAAHEYEEYLALDPDTQAGDTIRRQLDEWETLGVI